MQTEDLATRPDDGRFEFLTRKILLTEKMAPGDTFPKASMNG